MYSRFSTATLLAALGIASSSCVDKSTYYKIDDDVKAIADSIDNQDDLSHFYGGIVRLVAHDFMDYDAHGDNGMGSDGCIEFDHPTNAGLETVWCDDCEITKLYNKKYSHISKADFWIIAGNAVIRQTAIGDGLDMAGTFYWGRLDADQCSGSGDRIPVGTSCREVEATFLESMGLEWEDAVALMGAHTLGEAHDEFSGHHGYWVPPEESVIFDKRYYEELILRAWRPRKDGEEKQDWTSTHPDNPEPKFMLNTDMCLFYDIETSYPCCSRTDLFRSNGANRCDYEEDYSHTECMKYSSDSSRMAAVRAVVKFLGGTGPNSNQTPFYQAFEKAWYKATMNGADNLKPLKNSCSDSW